MIETGTDTKKIANYLGVTVQSVNRWKRGSASDIRLSSLRPLCIYFSCSLDYLVGRMDNNIKPSNIANKNFGEQIRKVLKSRGISTYRFRKDTRFCSSHLYDWDKGADPQLSTLIDLADYFNCTLDELVGFE